jgi:hypothetical protein
MMRGLMRRLKERVSGQLAEGDRGGRRVWTLGIKTRGEPCLSIRLLTSDHES